MPVTKTTPRRTAKTTAATKIKHTFPDGTVVTGTYDQLTAIAKALGCKLTGVSGSQRGYYASESKGLVKISNMNDFHIRRALIKRSKDYFLSTFDKNDTNREFLKKYIGLTEDTVIQDLYNELNKR
jgi:hypothetical protein